MFQFNMMLLLCTDDERCVTVETDLSGATPASLLDLTSSRKQMNLVIG